MRAAAHPGEEHEAGESSTGLLRVRLFGELDLRLGDAPLPPVESARARSLLGYLLVHGDAPHARQHLAFLLWPDSTEAQARTNLRNVLHTLRRAIPELERILEVTPRTLQRHPEARCWVDVTEFSSAVEAAEAAEAGSDRMVTALRAAVDLYVGDLLEDCYDEWLLEERERVRDRYVSALRRLVPALADRGEHAEAIRLGRELARCEPLNEDTYRLLMTLHDAAGDRAGAVRAYHQCASTLQRELGVEPSTATREAYAALMRSDQAHTDIDVERVGVGRAVFVGRDREWAQLVRCWKNAEAGRSQLVVVSGEAGVGKTRLVEELAAWCAHRGALVAHARAYATEGDVGYGMVLSWLRSADLAAQLRRADPVDVAELARLLPELGHLRGSAPAPADDGERRRRLHDAVARTVTATDRSTLLLADDAQWSDAQSVQLMHYLVRQATSPLLVVATVRREELEDDHPLAGLVSALQILDRTTDIRLGRLNRPDTAMLARHLAGTDVDAGYVDELFAETEGNPLFIVESIRAGGGTGDDARALSPKLQAVIGARLRQLSAPTRHLLGVAATVGRGFTAALVGGAARVDDVTLAQALDELWRRGVIREHGSDAYDFSHGKIRDVAYHQLSPATQRRTHRLLAETLQRLHQGDLDPVSGQVARHYDAAGQPADAARWYLVAAQQAIRLYASPEAVRHLDRARELVASLSGDPRLRFEHEILSLLPTALVGVEGFASERLVEAQHRAIEVAAALGVDLDPSLLRSLVMSRLCNNEFDEARDAADQLWALAKRLGDEALMTESEYLLGIAAFWAGAFTRARDHFERVGERFQPAQRGEHLVRFGHEPAIVCLSRLGNTLWFLGDDDGARRTRDRAVAMSVEAGHPYSRGTAYAFAFLLSVDLGDEGQLREYAGALSPQDRHVHTTEVVATGMRGFVEVLDGAADRGIARLRAALDLCGPVSPAPGARDALMRLFVAAHDLSGRPRTGLAAASEALILNGSRIWEAEIRRLRAQFLAAVGGDRAEIDKELARAAEVARRQGALGPERRIQRSRSHLRLSE